MHRGFRIAMRMTAFGAKLPVTQAPRNGKCCPKPAIRGTPSGLTQLGAKLSFALAPLVGPRCARNGR